MILAWICSETVKAEERTLSLGHSQSDFLESLKLHNNGRDIARFREQALRLFKSVIPWSTQTSYGEQVTESSACSTKAHRV